MRVLVTGGAGFIGRQVVGNLVEAGHEVRVLDALIPGVHQSDVPPPMPDGVEFVHGDLRDAATVAAALRGIDVVSHQAAMVGRGREILDAPLYVGCNDLGTAILLTEMVSAGLRKLVLASSVVIYGDSRYVCPSHGIVRPHRRSREDLDAGRFEPRCPRCGEEVAGEAVEEHDPLDPPRNVYAVTKLAQEYLVSAWARETDGSVVALRYHNVYGPGMPYESPYSGVASVFRSAVDRGEAPQVYEDGGPKRDFIHVHDIARANMTVLDWDQPGFHPFNVASGEPRTIGELAAALAEATAAPAPRITGRYRIGDVRHIFASPQKLFDEFEWRPSMTFETGVKDFARSPMNH
ncbi:NAD-dependent epimerase/dehydratase family protein [Kibdelosporangium phytohabitans]|uniref:NAD-dependent dehydratase n=1 Tax=Kibdelosporangium phytohabitans TaxID=860235 RepID=A0A0N9I4X2_9PSEU|nr:NAD-dependent epimerase/dehydratase family protein [Kibdelosporangium phytohabitans]ALG10929.1 NAD-dependent dehydratase [Kibdelosporangium phytohabitans]MBE1462122.1 dTDP-L-rhamnose 4-epimerase [Kibdelosporangium phytohabitans]